MDHHCSFTNRCSGKGTVKAFILFMFYINILMSILFYLAYSYIEKNDMWYFKNPKLNGAMMPSWENRYEYIFFPVRTDVNNMNWIDIILFLGIFHYYTYTGSSLLRCIYQFKQGVSAVIWIKAKYSDPSIWEKITPRSFSEVFEFIFGQ